MAERQPRPRLEVFASFFKKKRLLFFFEKKNQKTFENRNAARTARSSWAAGRRP
jgi:hypothetical protein